MSKIAFLFPGQGSQKPGMGKDLLDSYSELKDLTRLADQTLGFSITDICFNGSEDDLRLTQHTQPALFLVSMMMMTMIKKAGIQPHVAAGHSLGEYSAYTAAGVFDFVEGLKAVGRRGQLMAAADPEGKGTMASVMKLEDKQVEEICQAVKDKGVVVPANYNCPGQLVISGEKVAVEAAAEKCKEFGGRAIMLQVGGAFHSPLMEPASRELETHLQSVSLSEPAFPVYTNVSAAPISASEIRQSLVKQLVSPVRWTATIEAMLKDGVDTFVEIGTGAVLTGLVKRIAPDSSRVNVSDAASLKEFLDSH